MKAIVLNAILTSFSSRLDKSLGFRGTTPELTSAEKTALMDLQGVNLRLLLEPVDYASDGKVEVKGVLDSKPPSQRLRAVLFVLWKQLGSKGVKFEGDSFNNFYNGQMNRIIDDIKGQLEAET